jgi:hypothetical protein
MKAAILSVYVHADIRDKLGHALRVEGYDVAMASNASGTKFSVRVEFRSDPAQSCDMT